MTEKWNVVWDKV